MSDETPITVKSQMGQFGMVPVWVMSMPITDGEFRIYAAIRSFCDVGGDCYPTARAIAARTRVAWVDKKGREHQGCSVSAVHSAVARFRELRMMTTAPDYKPGTKIIARLMYHLVDLDPRRWAVVPASDGAASDPPSSAQVDPLAELSYTPYLSSATQENRPLQQTSEQTKEHAAFDQAAAAAPEGAVHASPRGGDGESAKPKQDLRQQKRQERDDAQARDLLVDTYGMHPDDAAILATYLRHNDNATTVAAYAQHLIDYGPGAVDEKLGLARVWAERLDNGEADDRGFFTRTWNLPQDAANQLAAALRYADAIGAASAANDAVNTAHARDGWTVNDLHAAVADAIAEREQQRKIGRQKKAARRRQEAA